MAQSLTDGLRTLGEEGVVELIAISGYYTMMAMALNVSDVPPTSGVRTAFP